jgi:hypothetical protein
MVLTDIRNEQAFVINLDRRPDRWTTFLNQPVLKEFKSLERFSAVDGKNLPILSDSRISLHTKENIKENYRRSHYEINTPGAIGASFSHITLWKKFLESDSKYLVVFEDDTIVDSVSLEIIDKLIPILPESGWDMWVLGTHKWGLDGVPVIKGHTKGWWYVHSFTGAHAYVLTRKGAEILLEQPFPIETHIEYYICACSKFKGLRIIKHWGLRMTYFAESTDIADSDTFLNRKTCPLCVIPDYYPKYGVYLTYEQVFGSLVFLLAGVGLWAGWKKV